MDGDLLPENFFLLLLLPQIQIMCNLISKMPRIHEPNIALIDLYQLKYYVGNAIEIKGNRFDKSQREDQQK